MRHLALLLCGVLPACDSGDAATPQGGRALASGYKMTGEARLDLPDGGVAECSLDLIWEIRDEVLRDDEHVAYKGVHGGGIYRSVRAADDSGVTFWLNVYGEIDARLVFPDRVELDIPINLGTGSRFYDNFAALRGTLDADGVGHGTWTCAPLDTEQDGHPDREYSTPGTWTIEPFEVEPEPPEDGFMLH